MSGLLRGVLAEPIAQGYAAFKHYCLVAFAEPPLIDSDTNA